jgi:hypothetical protein
LAIRAKLPADDSSTLPWPGTLWSGRRWALSGHFVAIWEGPLTSPTDSILQRQQWLLLLVDAAGELCTLQVDCPLYAWHGSISCALSMCAVSKTGAPPRGLPVAFSLAIRVRTRQVDDTLGGPRGPWPLGRTPPRGATMQPLLRRRLLLRRRRGILLDVRRREQVDHRARWRPGGAAAAGTVKAF